MKQSIFSHAAVFFVLISLILNIPVAAFAAQGDENVNNSKPEIQAVYYDQNGKKANGNELVSGDYKLKLILSGLSSVSQFEFTAALNAAVVVNNGSWCCDLAAEHADLASLCKITSGSIIICVASLNEFYSEISADEAVLFSADITVSSPVPLDMENVIIENESPDFTFAETNYDDIDTSSVPYTYSCFGFPDGTAVSSAAFHVTEMRFDMSPEPPSVFSVTGKVVAMLNPDAPNDSNGAPSLPDVDVIISNAVVATTDENGIFEIKNLESGTYDAVLHYANGYDRNFKIIVDGEPINNVDQPITMVPCDYDNNGIIDVNDSLVYLAALGKKDTQFADLNMDNLCDVNDSVIYYSFLGVRDVSNLYTNLILHN